MLIKEVTRVETLARDFERECEQVTSKKVFSFNERILRV